MINWQNGITPINETNMNKLVQEDMITDAYSSSSTYAVGDYCIYENTLYKCTTAIATAEAWNSGHWTAVSVADEIKELTNDTNITVESYLESGWITAKKIANLVIVTISCRMQNTLQNMWTDYTVAKLNGITSKYEANAPIVDQNTGLCADILISANSNEILINKRAVSSITGEWLRGQLLFIAN